MNIFTKNLKTLNANLVKRNLQIVLCFIMTFSFVFSNLYVSAKSKSEPVVIKSKINDSTVAQMDMIKSGDTTYINTTNQASSLNDIFVCYIDSNISVSNNKITIPPNQGKYWMIQFDGSAPIQIANVGGGGGASKFYTYYCTCVDNKICANNCGEMLHPVHINGRYTMACGNRKPDAPCPSCGTKPCITNCNTNTPLSSAFNESYVTKSSVIVFNNVVYE